MIVIRDASAEFIREPLLAPFGFKGNHVDELWQYLRIIAPAAGIR